VISTMPTAPSNAEVPITPSAVMRRPPDEPLLLSVSLSTLLTLVNTPIWSSARYSTAVATIKTTNMTRDTAKKNFITDHGSNRRRISRARRGPRPDAVVRLTAGLVVDPPATPVVVVAGADPVDLVRPGALPVVVIGEPVAPGEANTPARSDVGSATRAGPDWSSLASVVSLLVGSAGTDARPTAERPLAAASAASVSLCGPAVEVPAIPDVACVSVID
jgi:hypothetical protein